LFRVQFWKWTGRINVGGFKFMAFDYVAIFFYIGSIPVPALSCAALLLLLILDPVYFN
jgi:hypothetical protein